MKILGIIPARAGSKGVIRKNIRPMLGKSLVERAFDSARESGVLDRIILSSESEEIANLGRSIGLEVPFLRPAKFAQDKSPMIEVVQDALTRLKTEEGYEPDGVLLLQPTSPLRKPAHIQHAVSLLQENDAVCSVVPVPQELCPHYVMKIDGQGYLDYFLEEGRKIRRRQDVPQAYRRDGTIYLTATRVLFEEGNFYGKNCVPMIISAEESLSIDTEDQWQEAEKRLSTETVNP